jgi:MFS family permease
VPFAVVAMLVAAGFTRSAFAHLADLTEHLDGSRGAALGLYSLFLGMGQLVGGGLGAPMVANWRMDGLLLLTSLFVTVALVGVRFMPSGEESAEPLGYPGGSPLLQEG